MTKKIILALVALVLCLPTAMQAKVEHLLPKPQQVTVTPGVAFALSGAVSINYADGVAPCALLEEVFTENGCSIATGGKAVNVSYVQSIAGAHDYALHGYENEAYTLEITANEINITAVTETGVIRAAQTLAQLAEGYEGAKALEGLTMTDWPAFKLRGYMHDVGRSFISIDELVKQVELFSRFKVNTFHWHLTENQAWRFEVKAYPQLTDAASMTRFPGQYYTQEDCKRLLAVAKKHGVIVIPEIDMSGHSEAFERAMGFGMQTEDGKAALKKILNEVVEVFADVPYLHIGGDEVATTAAYLNEMLAYAESKSTNVKGGLWNPINNIGQNALNHTLAQMWGTRGYLATGKANIDCRYNYTNHFDVFADLVGIYKSTIYYSQQGSTEVAGAISGCWNDRKTPTQVDIMAQNNVWANVIATAERAWMGGGKQYIDNATNTPADYKKNPYGGGVMLPNSGDEYEEFKSWETRFLFHKANSLKAEPIPYVKQTNVRWRITDAFPNGGTTSTAFAPETYATSTNDAGLIPETFTHEGKTYYSGIATGAGIYLSHTWGNSIIKAYYPAPAYNQTAYAWTYVYSDKEQEVGAQIEFQNYSRSEQDPVPSAGNWDLYGSKIWLNGTEIAAPTYKNAGKSINREVDLLDENFPARTPIKVILKQGWNKVFLKLPYINAGYRLDKWMFTCVFTDLEGVNAVDGLIYSPNQCMDEATEVVAAKVSEIKRDRGNLIGTNVGLWPESAAATLDAKVKEVEDSYVDTNITAEQRKAQVTALETAWTAFVASLTEANMNQPVNGNYYRMYTPLRANRYATGNGVDTAITGPTEATTKASIWKFVSRGDGSYDIINVADGTYISPASNNNTALKTVAAKPDAGWSIKPAENTGNVIVVSGTAQFNQQKDGNLHLLNWGSGTNITDDGCEYRLIDVTDQIPPQPIVMLEGLGRETYPYAVDAALAAKVFAQENITIALDVTMPASMSANTRYALVTAADPTQGVTGATKTNSPYVAFGLNGSNPAYLPSSASGDKFTYREHSFVGNTNYKVVYVIDRTNKKFSIYVDGELKSSADYPVSDYELQSFSNFLDDANAKLYIGGGVVSTNAAYDKFGGQIRSVQFFGEALSTEKIAELEYPVNAEDLILSDAVAANNGMNIHGLQRHLGLVQNAGTGIEGDGQFVCNYPASTDQESGNAYANLIDGKYETFFHSGYDKTLGTGSHYLQVDLGKAVKNFRFYFKKRSQNNNNRPTKITIEGSNDKTAWTEVKVIDSGFPTDAAVLDYYSETIAGATAYQHYRFTVNTTNNSTVFYTFSEFYILPADYTKVNETFDAVRAYRANATLETAAELNKVYAWNKGLTEGSPVVGVESYLYVDTYKDSKFLNRYLYNNNGTLTPTTELQRGAAAFLWTPAVKEDGKYNFKNKEAKYLAHKGMSDNEHNFTVAATTHHMGVTLHTQGNNYFVVKNADGSFDQSSVTYDQTTTNYCTDFVFIPADLYDQSFEPVAIKSAEEFQNGGIYTFVTTRGWMGATASSNNVISTARTTVEPAASATNTYFQWAVYKSAKGNYYLYNIGKGKYMGVQSNNNASVPFVDAPNNKLLTFKQSSSTDYPIMFSTDNAGVVNHSANHGEGLITWADGWKTLNDEGSNHKVMLVGELSAAELKAITDLVDESEADEIQLFVKAEVEGLDASNPNTHFGNISVTSKFGGQSVKLKRSPEIVSIGYLDTPTTVINFTRAYRGFEFQGFFLGEENLGMSFSPSEIEELTTNETTPLVAKFSATDDVTLFYDDDPFSYRIPAIATTSTGRIIAVSDYRYSLDDIGRYNFGTANPGIDLVIRTSDDNGKTWSATKTIAKGSCVRGTDNCAYGDAAIAVVGEKVLVMGAAGDVMFGNGTATAHNRTVRILSEDNGETWTAPLDISETLFIGENATIKNGYTAFFGSGKLAVDANYNGTGKARIYGAMLIKKEGVGNAIYVIYTDDLGLTWDILGGSQNYITTNDEPKVEILPSGQILLSVRRGGGRQFNVFTYTDKATNAGNWDSNVNGCSNGGSNTCNGEPFIVDAVNTNGDPVKLLLQSQPKGGGGLYDRRDVTIWYKEITDANYTSQQIAADWTQGIQVSTQQSAYSAMTLQDDGKIAFFFEEAPCYGDDQAKGYCMVYTPLTIEAITNNNYTTPEAAEGGEEVTSADALPGDGTLRFYRLAIPVTKSAYEEDLGGSYDEVLAFWQECEDFVNKMFVPLGFCFDVVMDERLSNVEDLPVNDYNGLPEIGNCTYNLNNIIGETNYDVAMWVTHRDDYEENSGLSALKGAYSSTTKGSGYAKTDKWVVAHELGHMFGAVHTLQGEGSLMDNLGEFFSYPSIKAIRNSAKGTASYRNVTVANNAPQFDAELMKTTYRIPQGACLAIDVQATDIEKHQLMYTAIGCNSKNVDNVQEGVNMTLPFASFAPQRSNVISYAPIYTADLFYDDYFYLKEGTNINKMEPGTYPLSILVNDVPETAWNSEALATNPFYSTYAIWETQVQVVEGTAFAATLDTDKTNFIAGEKVTVKWGVNENYFTADSKVRISLSTDYGKTFNYVLAEAVAALDETCTVMLPNCNIGTVAVDFGTATRTMNGGVIKVEEIGSGVFTLTALDPNTHKGFTVTGATDEEDAVSTTLSSYGIGTFYANAAMTIPEGITAYVATSLPEMEGTEGTITLTALTEGIIPAKTGCVIRGAEGAYTFTKAATAGSVITDNLLRGYAGTEAYAEVALPTDGSTNYVLTVMDGVAGFYRKVAGFKVYNNKAYLNVPTNAKALRMRFVDADGTTEIHDVMIEQSADNCIYDLTGRRVRYAGKGVYIVNGKKVMR